MAVLPFPAFPGAVAFAGLGRKRASDGGGGPVTPPPGTRPTSLPSLTAPGAKIVAWYDFTDPANLTKAGDLVSGVANKATGAEALPALATLNEWGPPKQVVDVNGTLDALDFNHDDRQNFLTATGPGRAANGGVTALVLYSRKGYRRLDVYDDDPSRQAGQSFAYWPVSVVQRYPDGDFIFDVWNPQSSPVLHEVGSMGSANAPQAGWVLQRWLPSQAPISGVNVGGQTVQTLRSWWSGAPDAPTTLSVDASAEGSTGNIDVGSTGGDWQWANPSKDYLHEILVIKGVPNETDIAALKAWATARLIGKAGSDTQTPPDPPPQTGNAWDPPANWVVALDDHFDVVAPSNHGLDPANWKHTNYGTAPAHNGAANWDGGDGISVHDSMVEVKARKVGGAWYVAGFMQGGSADPASPFYHPGYGEFHVRMRARYSHAHSPGVGWYAVLWPASNDWSSEIDIVETPGADKTSAMATLHWNRTDSAVEDQSSASLTVDLTQWHTWDVRRTYRTVNGQTVATLRVWIDGVEVAAAGGARPNGWSDNPANLDNMVFGVASYVAPFDAQGWYSAEDGTTPAEVSGFIDRLQIWQPDVGAPSMTLTLEYPNGDPVAGAPYSFTAVSSGYATLQWAVFNSNDIAYSDWHAIPVGVGGRTAIATGTNLQANDYVQVRGINDPASTQYTPQATAGGGASTSSRVLYSGFAGVTLNSPNNGWQNLSGVDSDTGFDWTNGRVFGARPRIQRLNTTTLTEIITAAGRTGAQSSMLHLKLVSQDSGITQAPLLIEPTTAPQEFLIKAWYKLPANLAAILAAGVDGRWTAIGPELKTGPNGTNNAQGDFRIIHEITMNGSTPCWHVKWDNEANGNPKPAQIENPQNVTNVNVPVPVGEWFQVEFYFKRGDASNGRCYYKVNGQTVFDITGKTIGRNNAEVNRIFLGSPYSDAAGMEIWIDEVEVWDYSKGGPASSDVMITLQGQSNAYFLWDRGSSANNLKAGVEQLTGLGNKVHWNAGQNVTLFGGSGTYNIPADPSINWLNSGASGADPANPQSWPNTTLMQTAIDSVVAKRQEIAADRPWLFVRMHSEYDQKLGEWPEDASEANPYPAANRELIKRFRNAAQRSAALMPVFYFHVPYVYGTGAGYGTLEAAWKQDVANAGFNAFWAAGMEWGADTQDDGSHWDTPSSDFAASLVAMRLARWLHDKGHSPNNLSWLPTLGPSIAAVKRVAGNSAALDLIIQHDKGTNLIVPSGVNLDAFAIDDNGTPRTVTAISIVNPTTFRLTLGSNLTGPNELATLTYGVWSNHLGLGKVITDNWGSVSKPAYTPAWISPINMPVQRTRSPIQVTT